MASETEVDTQSPSCLINGDDLVSYHFYTGVQHVVRTILYGECELIVKEVGKGNKRVQKDRVAADLITWSTRAYHPTS